MSVNLTVVTTKSFGFKLSYDVTSISERQEGFQLFAKFLTGLRKELKVLVMPGPKNANPYYVYVENNKEVSAYINKHKKLFTPT